MTMTADEVKVWLGNYHQQCLDTFPGSWNKIFEHWFNYIAYDKLDEYGVDCWQRLGPRGFVVNMSAMRYRWVRLMELGREPSDPAMWNCLVDAFGFAILFNVCLEIPNLSQWSFDHIHPVDDDEWIIFNVWERDGVHLCGGECKSKTTDFSQEVGMRSLRMAFNMYRIASGMQK